MHFEYYRSVRQELESSRLWGGLVILGLCAAFSYFFIKSKNEVVSLFAFLLIAIVAAVHFFRLRKLSKTAGNWEVYVTDSEVVWKAPDGYGGGFVVPISEISKYIEESSSVNEYTSHYLELVNGTKLHLNLNVSNFDFASFSKALVSLGVKRESLIER